MNLERGNCVSSSERGGDSSASLCSVQRVRDAGIAGRSRAAIYESFFPERSNHFMTLITTHKWMMDALCILLMMHFRGTFMQFYDMVSCLHFHDFFDISTIGLPRKPSPDSK